MKKIEKTISYTLVFIFSIMLTGEWFSSQMNRNKIERDVANSELLVMFHEGVSDIRIKTLLEDEDIIHTSYVDGIYLLSVKNSSVRTEITDNLKKCSEVELVQPNYRYQDSDTEKFSVSSNRSVRMIGTKLVDKYQWGLFNDGTVIFRDVFDVGSGKIDSVAGIDTNIGPLWEYMKGKEGKPIVVAVLDSGIDVNHKALQDKILINTDEIQDDKKDNDRDGFKDNYYGWNTYSNSKDITDKDGHGTHVAGIIAANGSDSVWGVTGDAPIKILPVKVFYDGSKEEPESSYATSFSILRGIRYAKLNGVSICNLSLGMYESDIILKNYMKNKDMLFICAAGNDGKNLNKKPVYPAYYDLPNIISVGNIRWDGELHSTSNYEEDRVTVGAPGTNIYSSVPGNKYRYASGTSMAAPYVTGIAALLFSYLNHETPRTLKQRILLGANKTEELYNKNQADGIINAFGCLGVDIEPPVITKKISIYKSRGYAFVKVNCTDIGDAGVKTVLYLKGKCEKGDFKSGKKGILVGSDKKFKVRSSGYYTIYASDKNGNESISVVKVSIPVPKSVKLSRKYLIMHKGKSFQLKSYSVPVGVYAHCQYSSSKTSIATVSSNGKITAKKTGKVFITVKTQNGKKAVCYVTVK